MFGSKLQNQFAALGADVKLVVAGDQFQIGIEENNGAESFELRLPSDGSVTAKVVHADSDRRHLLLDVVHRNFGVHQKYLCGHDEFHWFVAALPERPAPGTVSEAMETLKPLAVIREQRGKHVKRKQRGKRRTKAYVRQGEWFFVPRTEFVPSDLSIEHSGALVRGASKPHRVERLCRDRAGRVFARGCVSHPDHATIRLNVWHEVFRNTEVQPEDTPMARRRNDVFVMTYVD